MNHKNIFSALSSVPNFKGKLFLLENYYKHFIKRAGTYQGKTWTGVDLSLLMEDRIQRRIFIKKAHEPETEFHLLKFAENSKCFLDIGANIGYFSMMVAKKFPAVSVYSFEPNPNNLKKIEENRRLNKVENIKIMNMCVSDSPGEVTFAVPPENESGWGRIENEHLPLTNFTKVSARAETLDHLFETNTFNGMQPDLIKIDIEGAELKAFKGAEKMIKACKPVLCVELNEECLIDNKTTSQELMSLLLGWGYKACYIDGKDLRQTDKPVSGYMHLNYFFIP